MHVISLKLHAFMEKLSDGLIENKLEKTSKFVTLMFLFPFVEKCYTRRKIRYWLNISKKAFLIHRLWRPVEKLCRHIGKAEIDLFLHKKMKWKIYRIIVKNQTLPMIYPFKMELEIKRTRNQGILILKTPICT